MKYLNYLFKTTSQKQNFHGYNFRFSNCPKFFIIVLEIIWSLTISAKILLMYTWIKEKFKMIVDQFSWILNNVCSLRLTLKKQWILFSSFFFLQRLIEAKIARIQSDIVKNQQTIREIKGYVRSMSRGDASVLDRLQLVLDQQETGLNEHLQNEVKVTDKKEAKGMKSVVYQSEGEVLLSSETCSLADDPNPKSDIQVSTKSSTYIWCSGQYKII